MQITVTWMCLTLGSSRSYVPTISLKFGNYVYEFFDRIHYEVCLLGEHRVLRFTYPEFLQQPAHEDDCAETYGSRAPKLIRCAVPYVERIFGADAQGFEHMAIGADLGFCMSNVA